MLPNILLISQVVRDHWTWRLSLTFHPVTLTSFTGSACRLYVRWPAAYHYGLIAFGWHSSRPLTRPQCTSTSILTGTCTSSLFSLSLSALSSPCILHSFFLASPESHRLPTLFVDRGLPVFPDTENIITIIVYTFLPRDAL